MDPRARHIRVDIARPVADVVAYAGDPARLPEWAAGLAAGIRPADDGDGWIADSPMGEVRVRFAPTNDLGVLDHDVTMPDGTVVHNPFHVFPHEGGSELVFTILPREGVGAAAVEADAAAVLADLERLRDILER